MKQYLLLRNNQESGPYFLEELLNQQLHPMDLIWIENETTAWLYATEVKELDGHIKKQMDPKPVQPSVFVSLPEGFHEKHIYENHLNGDLILNENGQVAETNFLQPLDVLKERDNGSISKKPVWQKRIFYLNDTLKLAGVFAGVVFAAFVMKKAADSPESNKELDSPVARIILEDPGNNQDYSNALVREVVTPVDAEKPVPKSIKPKDIRRQVKLQASDYKTGVLGGVSNLAITLLNASPHFIDRIEVKVDYLKKNGEIVESKNYTFRSLQPNSSKKIDIPKNRRGNKVKTSVNTIYSKEYKAALRHA